MNISKDCKQCFGTGWQALRAGSEWIKWPCQACLFREEQNVTAAEPAASVDRVSDASPRRGTYYPDRKVVESE